MLTDRSRTMDTDRFFKFFDEGMYEHTNGEVDSPTGWYGLLMVDAHLRDEYGKATGEIMPHTSVPDGLYLVVINSQGLVWAYQDDEAATPERADEVLYTKFRELNIDYSRYMADE